MFKEIRQCGPKNMWLPVIYNYVDNVLMWFWSTYLTAFIPLALCIETGFRI